MLNEKDVQELLALKPSDIGKDLFLNYFAYTKKGNPRFKLNDKFILPKANMGLKEDITTTVGRYIFNKFIIEPNFLDLIGYRNYTFDSGKFGALEGELSEALLNDKITAKQFGDYLNRVQWLGFTFSEVVSPSMSYNVFVPLDKVDKRKEELFKQYEKELAEGDAIVGAKIEQELLSIAKQELAGDPSMDLYNSGARAKFGNHYKNQAIMRGPIKDNATGKFRVATSNYADGIKKEEFNIFGDMITDGAYNRAVGTQQGGLRFEAHIKSL